MSKIGLVIEGGGMKCAYEAGVLDRFIDYNISFDYAIGVSAGSANMLSFLAGQRGRVFRFYVDHIKEPGYFGVKSLIKTGNLFGLQYIYGDLTNSDGADALNFEKLMQNPTPFHIVATNAISGQPYYFPKETLRKDDYREIMASCAIPMVSKPVELNGNYYYDGGISDSIPFEKAFEQGCDKLVVLSSKNRDFVRKPQGIKPVYKFALRKYPKVYEDIENRVAMYSAQQNKMFELERAGKVFLFAASKKIDIGTYTMNKEKNAELYNVGIDDFDMWKDEFLEFMKK